MAREAGDAIGRPGPSREGEHFPASRPWARPLRGVHSAQDSTGPVASYGQLKLTSWKR